MPQKPKARGSASKKSKAQKEKQQSERFIETARKLDVDETGESFERAFQKLVRSKSTGRQR